MKRLFAALAIATLFAVPFAAADFSDVTALNPNNTAINSLVEAGVLLGYEDGTFRPDQQVTRAEATKIILLGMNLEVNENSEGAAIFNDVSTEDWFYRIVGTAVDAGIIKGYEDGSFRPSQTVNRAEAMKIALIAGAIEDYFVVDSPFEDVDPEAWFASHADYAKTWNVEPAQLDGLWHPEGVITRGNISELVFRLQTVKLSGVAYDESTTWARHDFATISASMKVPFGWYHKTDGVGAIWLLDQENMQMSLLDPYANGATLLLTRYANPNSQSSRILFDQVLANHSEEATETTVNGYATLILNHTSGEAFKEWFIVLPNNNMVHLFSMRGNGAYAETLEDKIEQIVSTIEYQPEPLVDVDTEDIVEALRSSIQVDGKGNEMMALLTDLELIETDTIGVGTGPVDYFYSPSADITIKYERSFDVILDIQDGQSTAF